MNVVLEIVPTEKPPIGTVPGAPGKVQPPIGTVRGAPGKVQPPIGKVQGAPGTARRACSCSTVQPPVEDEEHP